MTDKRSGYRIIKKIAVIGTHGDEAIELNYVEWFQRRPGYDLRRWKNGEPLKKGVTLSEDEAENLFLVLYEELGYGMEAGQVDDDDEDDNIESNENTDDVEPDIEKVFYESGYDDDKEAADGNEFQREETDDADDDENDNVRTLDYRTFFVAKSMSECDQKGHDYYDVIATVPVLADKQTKDIEFPAKYCQNCNVYYVTQKTYHDLKNRGKVLCQLMTPEEYKKYKNGFNNAELSPQSPLRLFGYSVAQNGPSANERRNLLKWIIKNGILTKERVVSYLNYFMKRSQGDTRLASAVRKWREDKEYLTGIKMKGLDAPPMGVARFVNGKPTLYGDF